MPTAPNAASSAAAPPEHPPSVSDLSGVDNLKTSSSKMLELKSEPNPNKPCSSAPLHNSSDSASPVKNESTPEGVKGGEKLGKTQASIASSASSPEKRIEGLRATKDENGAGSPTKERSPLPGDTKKESDSLRSPRKTTFLFPVTEVAQTSPSRKRLRKVEEEETEDQHREEEDKDEDEGDEKDREDEAAVIAEEFNNWKVNTKVLYDLVLNSTLEWPSLTVQWIPGLADGMAGDKTTVRQKLLLGTHTSGDEGNSLIVMEVSLPASPIEDEAKKVYADRDSDYEGFAFGRTPCKFKIVRNFPHEGEVNCARSMPQKSDVVATLAPDGFAHLYNISLPSATATGSLLKLSGHKEEGFGLAWNPSQEGLLASASNAGSVCLHDINAAPGVRTPADAPNGGSISSEARILAPLRTFKCTDSAVNDCCWIPEESSTSATLLACCQDDGIISLWDTRVAAGGEAETKHSRPVSQNIRVFDRRRGGDLPVHFIEKAHKGEITRTAFSPCQSGMLCTSSRDRFVSLWDLKRIGQEQSDEDAEDGPPELLFSHGGHVAPVNDLSWNGEGIASLDKVIASVGEDNRLQIWQLKRGVFCDDDEEEETTPTIHENENENDEDLE
ncbi:p46 [Cystoisospora suis]|uniref:p46 n=1 Tax=Cystoisospora suis TaxID=483139 RepID=A0A2C6KVQ7_9APIC|nr:p46 [Cystoisospora suis]